MGYELRQLPSAKVELEAAMEYLELYSHKKAKRLMGEYKEMLGQIMSGTVLHSLSMNDYLAALGYRTAFLKEGYGFLYYLEADTVVVAHFFSQRQDYARLV